MKNTPERTLRALLPALKAALGAQQTARAAELATTLAGQGALPIIEVFSVCQQLTDAGQGPQAIALYRLWLERTKSPVAYAVLFNLGVCLSNAHDDPGAEQVYRRALELKPTFIEAHLNLATLLERKGEAQEALLLWNKVTGMASPAVAADKPFYLQALNNMGRLLEIRKQLPEAEGLLIKSLLADPDQPKVLTHVIHLRQKQCKWPIYEPIAGVSAQQMIEATSALAMLSASDDPQAQLDAARRFVAEKVMPQTATPLAPADGYRHDKLRIGYLSSDLCSHAVSILTVELFELHDREHFEVYAFSWSREDGTPLRARVVQAMDHYVPIGALSDEEAARAIRAREIDILVDLHGLTLGTRPDILSWRPAPVQLTYLGFPGPTALPCLDYVVADRFVLPPELAPYFTERPLYMPHVFQINDRQRPLGPCPTRTDSGLPEEGFVFCSFNNNFKFTEEMFACWMRILQRTPGSVLWLVADHEVVRQNLSASAQRLGIDPARLVFAPRVAPADYLARFQAADLFLDTLPFGAGTTASDALWAGLPLLACAGRTFGSRMAGSLLLAAGLPELVTTSLQEYEDKAVALAHDPAHIAEFKSRLAASRHSARLFDSPSQARDLEQLYRDVAKSPAALAPRIAAPAPTIAIPQEKPMQLPALTPIEDPNRVLNFMVQTVWGLTDPARFYALMAEAQKLCVAGTYLGDNLFTWGKSNSPFEDQAFVRAWESNTQNDADRAIAWRRYILACSAYHCAQLPGDFVECGVYRGTGIKTIIDYFGKDQFTKNFWGYDTFDYNPVQSHTFAGQTDGMFKEIEQRFAGYEQVKLVKGLLPESLEGNSPQQIAFLHIDLNKAEYEIAVLDVLFDRVVPGGMIILDDYEWAGQYRTQKIAEDAWFEKRQYRVFPLPTGQGMVLKR
jgi:predicted O-linked N-acetylglucosamine transferase (SPINDLY family)